MNRPRPLRARSLFATSEAKLQKLYEYCREKIKNLDDDASGMTSDERLKIKDSKSAADTLKRGAGTSRDIDLLFATLARAAGFDARVAMMADRNDIFFDKNFPDDYFMNLFNIAVKVGEEWRFYDPSSMYVPFGMLPWREEAQQALVSDSKAPFFALTQISQADRTIEKRTARLRLSDDGALEGDVRIEYTGHMAAERKEYNDDDSPAEREQTLRDEVHQQLSTAELTNIRIENVTEAVKPFVYSYHIRIPDYAQRTGKRLFVQPEIFEHGAGAQFSTSARLHPIYFHYPWTEDDTVMIELPAGYALDSPESPGSFTMGDSGSYNVKLGIAKDNRALMYRRTFRFNAILFPTDSYAQLKRVFDAIHEQDNHTITLKQGAAIAAKQ